MEVYLGVPVIVPLSVIFFNAGFEGTPMHADPGVQFCPSKTTSDNTKI